MYYLLRQQRILGYRFLGIIEISDSFVHRKISKDMLVLGGNDDNVGDMISIGEA